MTNSNKLPAIERHTQTILTGIVAGLIGWVGISVSQQATSIALLQQSLDQIQRKVEILTPLASKITELEIRHNYNESRIDKIEKDLYVEYVNPHKKL